MSTSSKRRSRSSDSTIASAEPPGRSTRPNEPANSVSPLYRRPASRVEQADRALGVAGRVQDPQPDGPEPDLAALGELDGGHRRRDLERRPQRLAGRSAGRHRADGRRSGRPCARRPAALSPMWSQWPWVQTISLSVQSRASSSPATHSSDGIAVSIAMASRVASSARTWTFVASGPTTRDSAPDRCATPSPSGLELRPHAVEGLADHLVRGALDQARADARDACPRSRRRRTSPSSWARSGAALRCISPVASTALPGAWPLGLDHRAVRRLAARPSHVRR